MTGLVALLLQQEPGLKPDDLKSRLRNASRIPGQAPNVFLKEWGFGLIDASQLI
jgi:hypothetical protein